MREKALWQRKFGGPQERRPIDGMEAQDFFADQVEVGGPEAFSIDCAHVGGKRVEPDIEDVRGFVRDGNAPFDGGPADGDVLEALLHERDHFIAARFRADEFGIVFVELEQPLLERRKLEVEILLGDGFGGASAIRAGIARLGFVDVQLIEDAILAGVVALVDVAAFDAAVEQILDNFGVLGIGGALETVDLQVERLPLLAEFVRDEIGELLRRFAGRRGGALDLLAVLVSAGRRGSPARSPACVSGA